MLSLKRHAWKKAVVCGEDDTTQNLVALVHEEEVDDNIMRADKKTVSFVYPLLKLASVY